MYDSIRAASIPSGAVVVAGYIDGTYNDWAALLADFPNVPKVAIDVNGGAPGAEVRDWETGDKGGNLEQWVIDHNQLSGYSDAVIYCNRSTISEVRRLTGSQVLGKDYWLWIATGDGSIYGPGQLKGVMACQYLWTPAFDVSKVWPVPSIFWTNGQLSPLPPPPPVIPTPVCGVPNNLTEIGVGPTSVKFSFTPSRDSSVPTALYQVVVCEGSGIGPVIETYPRVIPGSTATSFTKQYGSLTPSTAYTLGVRAIAASGHQASPWVTFQFTTAHG